ncbi:hypothetical protein ACHQM5_022066 [Ranunculus cassubicifolius]
MVPSLIRFLFQISPASCERQSNLSNKKMSAITRFLMEAIAAGNQSSVLSTMKFAVVEPRFSVLFRVCFRQL